MTETTNLNPSQALMLAILHSGSVTGADIVRVAESMDFWTFSRSQVYREVQHLRRIGAITSSEVNGRSALLILTKHGRELYAQWSATFPDHVDVQIRDGWYLRARLAEYDGSNVAAARIEAAAGHAESARVQRHQGLPGPIPPAARAWAAYHDVMSALMGSLSDGG